MALTLSQMASRVLRNVQIDEDSSTSSVQALADAKQWINERARDVWKRRLWREFIILGTYSVPASTYDITLANITVDARFTSSGGYSAAFAEIVAVRNGTEPLRPEDFGAINSVKPDLWASTDDPIRYINRGARGITLLGTFDSATTISFFGKAATTDLGDSDSWIMANDECLIYGASADFIKFHERDENRANTNYQQYEAEIAKMIDAAEVQAGNEKRIIPINPWTDFDRAYTRDTTATGSSLYY